MRFKKWIQVDPNESKKDFPKFAIRAGYGETILKPLESFWNRFETI